MTAKEDKNWADRIQRGNISPEKFTLNDLYLLNFDGKNVDKHGKTLRTFQIELDSIFAKAMVASYIYAASNSIIQYKGDEKTKVREVINKGLQELGYTDKGLPFNQLDMVSRQYQRKKFNGYETNHNDLKNFFEFVEGFIKPEAFTTTTTEREEIRIAMNRYKNGYIDRDKSHHLGWDTAQRFVSEKIEELSKSRDFLHMEYMRGIDRHVSTRALDRALRASGHGDMSLNEVQENLDYYLNLFNKMTMFRDNDVKFDNNIWKKLINDYKESKDINNVVHPPKQVEPQKPSVVRLNKLAEMVSEVSQTFSNKTLNKGIKSFFSALRKSKQGRFEGAVSNMADLIRSTNAFNSIEMTDIFEKYLQHYAEKHQLEIKHEEMKLSDSFYASSKTNIEVRLNYKKLAKPSVTTGVYKYGYDISRVGEIKSTHEVIQHIKSSVEDRVYDIRRRIKPEVEDNVFEFADVKSSLLISGGKYIRDIHTDIQAVFSSPEIMKLMEDNNVKFSIPSYEDFCKQEVFEDTYKKLNSFSQNLYFNAVQEIKDHKFRGEYFDLAAETIMNTKQIDLTDFAKSKLDWAAERVESIRLRDEKIQKNKASKGFDL